VWNLDGLRMFGELEEFRGALGNLEKFGILKTPLKFNFNNKKPIKILFLQKTSNKQIKNQKWAQNC
jgi:hypothetical protein